MKTTTIKGTSYTYKKLQPYYGVTNIYSLYERPSHKKVRIYNERKEKLDGIYGLTGNKFNFSIYGYVVDENGTRHEVKITPSYNYILD